MSESTVLRSKFFTADRISPSTIRIEGLAGELCYLVEGRERALLIDGLTGAGSLKAFVRELTDLPVTLALTHGHLDHAGAAWEYKKCFVDPRDIALLYSSETASPQSRLDFVCSKLKTGVRPDLADMTGPGPIVTLPMAEGDVFDLGGVCLEVISVPGHTRGSVAFLNRGERILFSGDACNANTILMFDESTSVLTYAESLRHLGGYRDAFDVMYGGHKKGPVPKSIIDDALTLCERILAGTDDAVPFRARGGKTGYFASERREDFTPKCGGYANILYSREKITGDSQAIQTIQNHL